MKQDGVKKRKERFIEAYKAKAGNISKACEAAGIARITYYRWVEKDKRFIQKVNDADEALKDFVESALIQAVQKGNMTAIIFYSKTQMKDRGYVERQELAHFSPNAISIEFKEPSNKKIVDP